MRSTGRPDFIVLSRADAESYTPTGVEVCVSISDRGEPPADLSSRFVSVLRVTFSDITSMRLKRDGDIVFGAAHAEAILDFIARHRDVERVVVHCQKGRSRSAAVAVSLCEMLSGPVKELEARFPDWNRLIRVALKEAAAKRDAGNDVN